MRDEAAGKPVSKAYVKVYARLKNGTVRFFKDGYTDLRGKFDYASLNSSASPSREPMARDRSGSGSGENMSYQMLKPEELKLVEKLAILILSDAHGATVREVNPPSRSRDGMPGLRMRAALCYPHAMSPDSLIAPMHLDHAKAS